MKTARRRSSSRAAPSRRPAGLRARLDAAEEALRAVRAGEVDAVVVAGRGGSQVFTLEGAEHAYRTLIERMNEGALTLTTDKTVLYANERFARMVKRPLEQVMGGSFRRFLSVEDRATLKELLKRPGTAGSTFQVLLHAGDGARVPAQISIRPLPSAGPGRATVGMVVTDMTEARRSEEMLRALARRVVEVQEAERGRLALDLHDRITQPLCAVLFRSQALADSLAARDGPAKEEAMKLREMLGQAAGEVERISRSLRPGVLEQLGLVAVVRTCTRDFADRTGVSVELQCVETSDRLPADSELALYRILQGALKNVEQHARARHVAVGLGREGAFVHLSIADDGIGFDPKRRRAGGRAMRGLGLLGMGERAAYVGGTLDVQSARGKGTTVRAQVPHGVDAGSVRPTRERARRRLRR